MCTTKLRQSCSFRGLLLFAVLLATCAAPGARASAPAGSPAAMALRHVRGAYFGQPLPGETPVLFAPAILAALSPWVEGTEFSPDGTQFFAGVGDSSYSSARLLYSRLVKGSWTPFVAAPFTAGFGFSHEAVFSADGTTLTFTGRTADGAQGLWNVACSKQGWGTPVPLPAPINNDDREWRGSSTLDGTFYFGRAHAGMNQVYEAHKAATGTLVVDSLGAPVNTQSYEGDPCVAPDGHFLVFYSGRGGSVGGTDLYVSFRTAQGGWGEPLNLGDAFNSSYDEYGAHVSADGRWLFFTRHTPQGNGIYWVATSAIEKLKP
jgi:hypothetical protein